MKISNSIFLGLLLLIVLVGGGLYLYIEKNSIGIYNFDSPNIEKRIVVDNKTDSLNPVIGKDMDEDMAGYHAIKMFINTGNTKIPEVCLKYEVREKFSHSIVFDILGVYDNYFCKDISNKDKLIGKVKVDTLNAKTYLFDNFTQEFNVLKLENFPPMFDKIFCENLINKTPTESFILLGNKNNSGYCPVNVSSDVTLLFSFENISSSSTDPAFVLNIYDSNKVLLQTLPIEYNWEISPITMNIHDDINFDGYRDLLLRVMGIRSSQFTYYRYNPSLKIFEEDEVLFSIFLPTFDINKKTISSTADTPNYYWDDEGNQKYYTPEEQTTVFKFENGEYKILD